ncbi:MAG TPA: hypothetical protein VKN18_19345 [Blastocatellia bacterium]|nr:hypothetical protein [Blastocatellia bacterium]
MRPRARNNNLLDSMTLSIVLGIVTGSVYASLGIFVSNPMAAGAAIFIGLIVCFYLDGFFHGRAKRFYVGWLLLFLLISFLVGYMVFLFDID